jgi:branched-subunit amino acid permease
MAKIVDRTMIPVQVIGRIVKPVLIIVIAIIIIPIVPVIILSEGEPGEQEQGRQNCC